MQREIPTMRLLRALLCAVSVAGLAACAGTNAAPDSTSPSDPGPNLSQPFTGLPGLGGSNNTPAAAPAVASAEPAAPAPRASTQRNQRARPQAGYRGGAQVAAPAEPSDEPELTPDQQVYKFKGQCWMETEKQRTSDVDKRIALVDKCVDGKMKAANIKSN
jgi:hypothetical protein